MTLFEIIDAINSLSMNGEHSFGELQLLRNDYYGVRPVTWKPFKRHAFFERKRYAFHSGGMSELQFNIGEVEHDGKKVFRIGLAFSFIPSRTEPNPVEMMLSRINRFNSFININPDFFNGYEIWVWDNLVYYKYSASVIPIETGLIKSGNFIFIGKYINKTQNEIDQDDIKIIVEIFDYLLTAYKEIQLGKELQYADNDIYIEQPEFFTEEDLAVLEKWAGGKYDKHNAKHVKAREKIRDTLYAKTEYWAQEVANKLKSFKYKGRRNPLKRGTPCTFQQYTWMRIMRIEDENKDIYFTVGAEATDYGLAYKLDYQHDDSSKLNDNQKNLVNYNIPEGAKRKVIHIKDFENYNWTKLINETVMFINNFTDHYDNLIALAWDNWQNAILEKTSPPEGLDELSEDNFNFTGKDNIDFEGKRRAQKQLGDRGEFLVEKCEKQKLITANRQDLAVKVKKEPDGVGYDILSYDLEGNEIFIEVKTTRGGINTPFHLTKRERLCFEKDKGKYQIYRLFDFGKANKKVDYYIVDNLEQVHLEPVEYKVYWKKQG